MEENKTPQPAEAIPPTNAPTKAESKPKKLPFGLSGKLFAVLCVLLAVIIALGSAFSISVVKLYQSRRHGAVYDMDSELTLAEKGDMVPIWNPDFGYGAIPAHEGVPVSTYKEESLEPTQKGSSITTKMASLPLTQVLMFRLLTATLILRQLKITALTLLLSV